MLRSDLSGTGYDGWQALDPTPHNKQSGCFRVGPVPVAAIREKKVYIEIITGACLSLMTVTDLQETKLWL